MMSIFKHFDAYTLRARVYPALLAGLPTLAFLLLMVPWDGFHISQTISAAMAVVLLVAFADFARRLGRKVEARLGTRATAELWHRNDNTIDPISKDRYRAFIATKLNVTAPSAETELTAPATADAFYLSAGNWLRDHTRDARKFRILADELQAYGFRRNLLGLKPLALCMNALVLGLCTVAIVLPIPVDFIPPQPPGRFLIAIIAVIFHSSFLLFAVNEQGVREASQCYGVQLILSCETLLTPPHRPPRKRTKVPETTP